MRTRGDAYQHQLLLKEARNLDAIYDSINYIASCPWIINKKVIDLLNMII